MNRIAFYSSLAFMLISVSVFGYLEKTAALVGAITASAIGMAFANLDKIARFKGAGFEAQMKEAVQEAYATTDSLRDLAIVMARAVSDILAVENRYAGIKDIHKLDIKKNIDCILRDAGIDDRKIKHAGRLFDAYIHFDHAKRLANLASKTPDISDQAKQAVEEMAVFSKTGDLDELYAASPVEFRKFLSEHDLKSKEIEEALEDYEYFVEKYDFRRPEQCRV